MKSSGGYRADLDAALNALTAPTIGYGKLLKSAASTLDSSERVLCAVLGQVDSQYFNKDMAVLILTTSRVLIAAKPMAPMTKTRTESIRLANVSGVETHDSVSAYGNVRVVVTGPGGTDAIDEVAAPDAATFVQIARSTLAQPRE